MCKITVQLSLNRPQMVSIKATTSIETLYRPNGTVYKDKVKDGQPHGGITMI